jgi:diguanylate cyclase (GGDEF)-like protein/PAS domain S-box-containing protein
VFSNPRAETLFGYDRGQLIDRDIETLLPQPLATDGPSREQSGLRRDRSEFPVEVELSHLETPDGQFTLASIVDITERKRAESELRAHQQRLLWTLQASHGGAWRWDLLTGVADWSAEMYELWGVAPGTRMETDNSMALVDERDRQRVSDTIGKGIAEKADVHYEFRVHHSRRGLRWMETFARATFDSQGQAVSMLGLTLDITERKEIEANLQQLNAELEQRVHLRTLALAANEAKLRALFEVLPVGVSILDQQRRMTDSNPALHRILEITPAGLEAGQYANRRYLAPDGLPLPPEQLASIRALAEHRPVLNVETGVQLESGRTIWTSVSAAPLTPAELGVVVVTADISERRRVEAELQAANEQLTGRVAELDASKREISTLSQLGDMLQACQTLDEAYEVIARSGQLLYPEAAGALGLLKSSRNVIEVASSWGDPDLARLAFAPDECWGLRRGRVHVVHPAQAATNQAYLGPWCDHTSPARPAATICIPLMAQNDTLGVLILQVASSGPAVDRLTSTGGLQLAHALADHIALAIGNLRLRESLRHQSIRDPLTGLYNRRFFEEWMERELHRAARGKQPLALILIDLDHFKRVNDKYGHEAGDLVLKEIGGLVSRTIRGGDVACRLGGEEFVLALPEADQEAASRRGEQLRAAVKELKLVYRGQAMGPFSISAGIATFPAHATRAEELLRLADSALYRAKHAGRDTVMVG